MHYAAGNRTSDKEGVITTRLRESIIRTYLKFRAGVDEVYSDFQRKFFSLGVAQESIIEYMDNGYIIISVDTCPLVMQFEEEDCLEEKSLRCTVKEKHPQPGDESMMMQVWYPDSFISNQERMEFILRFFKCTKIIACMQMIDKETAKHRKRVFGKEG